MLLKSIAAAILACSVLMLAGCPKQTLSSSGTESAKNGPSVTITYTVTWDPAGSALIDFDATQALLNLSLTNATISSTSGTTTVSVKDLTTGQIVGQQAFGYVVNGNNLYAQDPTAVYNWLQQFTGYASIDVIVDTPTNLLTTSGGSASSTGSALYQGLSYASSTVSWVYSDTTGGTCHTQVCLNQQ